MAGLIEIEAYSACQLSWSWGFGRALQKAETCINCDAKRNEMKLTEIISLVSRYLVGGVISNIFLRYACNINCQNCVKLSNVILECNQEYGIVQHTG